MNTKLKKGNDEDGYVKRLNVRLHDTVTGGRTVVERRSQRLDGQSDYQ